MGNVFLLNQYVKQIPPDILEGVVNTVGTLICFRLAGYHDAAYLVKDIFPAPDFITEVQREVSFNPRTLVEVKSTEKPLGWEGLAHQLTHLKQREYWIRLRGPNLPRKQRTLDLPDPVRTPELEALVERLYAASGERFGVRKRDLKRQLAAERRGGVDLEPLPDMSDANANTAPFWEALVEKQRGAA